MIGGLDHYGSQPFKSSQHITDISFDTVYDC